MRVSRWYFTHHPTAFDCPRTDQAKPSTTSHSNTGVRVEPIYRLRSGTVKDPFHTYGPPGLCTWQIEKLGRDKGVFWFQTTERQFARRLSKREDTRRVESTGFNHFRQTYEMEGSWRKVKRIIDRYILSAGDRILAPNSLQNAPDLSGRVMTADITSRGILSTGDHNFDSDVAKDCSKIVPRVKTAGASVRGHSDDGREP
jgi:hypothetical protein